LHDSFKYTPHINFASERETPTNASARRPAAKITFSRAIFIPACL